VHAERGEQIQIVREIEESAVGDQVAAERDHERLAAERVDVRGDRLKPVDEPILTRQALPAGRLQRSGRAVRLRLPVCWVRDGLLLLGHGCEARAMRGATRGNISGLRV
jgi:hypothetical protein